MSSYTFSVEDLKRIHKSLDDWDELAIAPLFEETCIKFNSIYKKRIALPFELNQLSSRVKEGFFDGEPFFSIAHEKGVGYSPIFEELKMWYKVIFYGRGGKKMHERILSLAEKQSIESLIRRAAERLARDYHYYDLYDPIPNSYDIWSVESI